MAILINDNSARVQYTATSSQTVFTVPFEFFANADLKVYQNSTLKTITTHYTVTGAGVTGGGTVTFVTGATLNDVITIVRDVAVARVTDFPTSGPFVIEDLNTDLDRLTAMIQQQETKLSRTLRLDDFDTPNTFTVLPAKATRASKLLSFDANGNSETTLSAGDISSAQSYATAAAASAAAAAASLDAFDDIYLGAYSTNPTLDNDGNALTIGDQYFNTTANELRIWNGSSWQSPSVIGGTVATLNVSEVASFADGSAALPSITNDGDTNTGIFFPAADTIAFAEGGTEVMRINSSGQIETTAGTAALPAITTTGDINTGIFFPSADTIAFTEGGAEAMRINSSGDVGIGETNPTRKLDVAGTAAATYFMMSSNTASAPVVDAAITRPANGTLAVITNSAERMRINSSGDVGIGETNPTAPLDVKVGTGNFTVGLQGTANTQLTATGTLRFDTTAGTTVFTQNTTESMRLDSSGNLLFNSGYGSAATAYGCRAWVCFNGGANTNLTGTYSQSGTTVTVTATAHGHLVGERVNVDITSGTGVDGGYVITTVANANTFTYTAGTSLTTSGNVTLTRNTIRGDGNVDVIADYGAGDYGVFLTTAMPDLTFATIASAGNGDGTNGYTSSDFGNVRTTRSVRVSTLNAAGTQIDLAYVSVAIFR